MQLLFDESEIDRSPPKVSAADKARAMGVSVKTLKRGIVPDSRAVRMSKKEWEDYKRVARSKGVSSRKLMQLAADREIYKQKQKCPGRWNSKTGCREREWYMKARDTGQEVIQEVARSPITQAALVAASFTPLAAVTVPVGVGLQVADAAVSGRAIDLETVGRVAAGAAGVPVQTVDMGVAAVKTVEAASQGDWQGAARAAASAGTSAVGLPGELEPLEELIPIATSAAKGDWEGAARQAGAAAGVELPTLPSELEPLEELFPIAESVAKGDYQGAARKGAKAAGIKAPKIPPQVAHRVGQAQDVGKALARGDYSGAAHKARKAAGVKVPAKITQARKAAQQARATARQAINTARSLPTDKFSALAAPVGQARMVSYGGSLLDARFG